MQLGMDLSLTAPRLAGQAVTSDPAILSIGLRKNSGPASD